MTEGTARAESGTVETRAVLRATITPKTLNALFTRNGGEVIGPDF